MRRFAQVNRRAVGENFLVRGKIPPCAARRGNAPRFSDSLRNEDAIHAVSVMIRHSGKERAMVISSGWRRSFAAGALAGTLTFTGTVLKPAQAQQQTRVLTPDSGTPVFRVDVVSRSIKVVNFHHRQGATEMVLKGTAASPRSNGTARIDSRQGATKVEVRAAKLLPPQAQGEEYLTYVLWAITPEGRPENLGELVAGSDGDAALQAATELQSFGLIVTAEPYFAVTQPSDAIVMEAEAAKGTTGTIAPLEAKYELWPKGMYASRLPEAQRIWSRKTGKEAPPALTQARHAVAIARSVGGDRFAADTMKKAEADLGNAEAFFNNKGDTKRIQTLSRNATQLAEDARLIAIKRAEEERLEAERAAAAQRLAAAQTAAEQEARRRELADSERKLAEERALNAKLQAEQEARERQRLETENSRLAEARATADQARQAAIAEQEQLKAQKAAIAAEAEQARQLAAQAEQSRLAAEEARKQALAEQARLESQQQQLRRDAEQAQAAATAADQARRVAETERTRMRDQLREQLNAVLATRESARGLIVNMADVLFETGRYDLRPGAREKLARVAGILATHPELRLEVEGHTDSVGGDAFNQTLSEQRAEAVRSYLVSQGVKSESVNAAGFGKSRPVADNRTSAGRQQNRRVEIVVSGESIQSGTAAASASSQQAQERKIQ